MNTVTRSLLALLALVSVAHAQAPGPKPPPPLYDFRNADQVPRSGGSSLLLCPLPGKGTCKDIYYPQGGTTVHLFHSVTGLPSGATLNGNTITPTATTVSVAYALGGSGLTQTAKITNNGSVTIYYNLGTSSSIAATSGNSALGAGLTVEVPVGQNTYIALLAASGTASVSVNSSTGVITGLPGYCDGFHIGGEADAMLTMNNWLLNFYADDDNFGTSMSVSGASSNMPTGSNSPYNLLMVTNIGANPANVAVGASSVTASSTGQSIAPGSTVPVMLNGGTYIAAIAPSGNTTLVVSAPSMSVPMFALAGYVNNPGTLSSFPYNGFQTDHISMDVVTGAPEVAWSMKVTMPWKTAVAVDVWVPASTGITGQIWYGPMDCQIGSNGPWGRFQHIHSALLGTAGLLDNSNTASNQTAAVAAGGQTSNATTLSLASAFGTAVKNYSLIQVDQEVEEVLSGGGTTTLTVARGYNGTNPQAHSAAATVTTANGLVSIAPYQANAATVFNVNNTGPGALYFYSHAETGNGSTIEGAPLNTPDGASVATMLGNGGEDYHMHTFGGQFCPSTTGIAGWFVGAICNVVGSWTEAGYRFHDEVGTVMWNNSDKLQETNGILGAGTVNGSVQDVAMAIYSGAN